MREPEIKREREGERLNQRGRGKRYKVADKEGEPEKESVKDIELKKEREGER